MSEIPLRFVVGEGYGDGCICCPLCGDSYVHPGPVVIEQGRTKTVVKDENTSVVPTDRSKRKRGSSITLLFWCESGHTFAYEYEFHKGITTVAIHVGEYVDFPAGSLWRD